VKEYDLVANNVKCLWLEVSGNRVHGPREGHQGVVSFYVDPDVDIREGDLVVDISGSDGIVIEAGPFYAESVKKIGSPISGRVHHQSVKLKGESV
jgi:hypothetical protein